MMYFVSKNHILGDKLTCVHVRVYVCITQSICTSLCLGRRTSMWKYHDPHDMLIRYRISRGQKSDADQDERAG